MPLTAYVRSLLGTAGLALGLAGCAGHGANGPVATDAAGLQSLAERGNPIAANNLGVMYANGNKVPQDFAEAKKWYLFASEHGNPAGEFNLGIAYEKGQGTAVDLPEAIKWLHLAADHNMAPAKMELATLYSTGKGVPRDMTEAARLARSAALQNLAVAQVYLGALYIDGTGVPSDDSLGYQWASIGASKLTGPLGMMANKIRDNAARGLSTSELTAAQAATATWKPGTEPVSLFPPGSAPRPARLRDSGSGFIVGKSGEIATDFHVVPNCTEIKLIDPIGKYHKSSHVVAEDREDDLALLAGGEFGARLKIRGAPAALGESITSYGFPLGPVLSSTGNLTSGTVSSTAGMQGNAKSFQITAPEQAGNSGGPVVDETGAVIGIVASKLNALVVAAATGDLAQNVNFAWHISLLQKLMDQKGISYDLGSKGPAKSGVDLAGILQKGTVKIECWR
jgi:S1-C subfamily serine protease